MTQETEVLKRLFDLLEEYHENRHSGTFVDYKSPGELERLLELEHPECEGDWERLLQWIRLYLRYGVKTAHPAFLNRMWTGANLPSILGEMVTAISNTSSCTFESAPVSTLMEKYMIGQMLELTGFTHGEGQMTTGSSNANMIAMMCARNKASKQVKKEGLFGQKRLYAFVNADAHYSMDKAANILGIGSDQLIKIPGNSGGEMEGPALQTAIEAVAAEGGVPFFVGVTAGTTVRGAFDPILPALELRDRFGFWLHVDGAWGGAAVMSERLRKQFLPGLSKADSFTFDFHKMLGSSLICNILLLNNSSHTLGATLAAGDGTYMFRDTHENEVQDLGSVSLQCGRRVDSLKWFLDWKYFGKSGFSQRVENYLDLCVFAEECVLTYPELEMVAPRVSFNVCFRYKVPEQLSNDFNKTLRTTLYKKSISLVSTTFIGNQLALRLLITNTVVDRSHIKRFFEDLVEVGRKLEGEDVLN